MILYTTIKGEGDPIVFLHSELQTGATDYQYQRDYFHENHQVIYPDLRGHGDSLSDHYSQYFIDTASDLYETFQYFNINKAHIVGASVGALVGIIFARRYPEMVKSLTVSGIMSKKPANWNKIHGQAVDLDRQLLRNDEAVEYYNRLHHANWREMIYLARDKNWYPFDQTKGLADIGVPILLIVGEGNPNEVRGISTYFDTSHVHIAVIPFASHLVHQEQPEWYTRAVEQFIHR